MVDDYLESVEGIRSNLIQKSKPNDLVFIGELMSGRKFSPKMVSACLPLSVTVENSIGREGLDIASTMTGDVFYIGYW